MSQIHLFLNWTGPQSVKDSVAHPHSKFRDVSSPPPQERILGWYLDLTLGHTIVPPLLSNWA